MPSHQFSTSTHPNFVHLKVDRDIAQDFKLSLGTGTLAQYLYPTHLFNVK